MIYLLDANVLIDAERDYYPMDMIPQFWVWLEDRAAAGAVCVPAEVYDEVTAGRGPLPDWLKKAAVKMSLGLRKSLAKILLPVLRQMVTPRI